MDSKAECDQLNLAHVSRKKIQKEETKTNKRSTHLVQYRFKVREGSPMLLLDLTVGCSLSFVSNVPCLCPPHRINCSC